MTAVTDRVEAPPGSRETGVLVVGAGPAGLMLASELRLAGVDAILIERNHNRPGFCRGFNLNARALDILGRRGLAEMVIAEGWRVPHVAFSGLPVTLNLPGAATDHPYSLGIPQTRVEEILEAHALALGVTLLRGHELTAFEQDPYGVTAAVTTDRGEYRVRAAYLVGCDGGRSTVRKRAGIGFPGTAASRFSLLGDVELGDPDAVTFGVSSGPGGAVFVIPRPGYVRIISEDPRPPADKDTPVTLDLLQSTVDRALGKRVELREPRWLTRFGNAARQAADYVRGRVILAGDAAHIHPPAGAIGVNVALDDAFNLGWKLAATVRGTAPSHLLDSYHTERHPIGAQILASTRAQVLLGNADERLGPLIDLLTRVANHPAGNRAFTETITGLDTHYDMRPDTSAPHPWLGRLAPDIPLATDTGHMNLTALLASGHGVLLHLSGEDVLYREARGWADRVDVISARCPDRPELRALLVRPDGHTAWLETTDGDRTGDLPTALHRWYGTATPQPA